LIDFPDVLNAARLEALRTLSVCSFQVSHTAAALPLTSFSNTSPTSVSRPHRVRTAKFSCGLYLEVCTRTRPSSLYHTANLVRYHTPSDSDTTTTVTTPRLQSLHHSACTTACTTACTSRVNEVSPSRPCRALRSRRSHGRRIHCQGQRGASRQRRYHVNQHLISSLVVQY
jgi:hypothetical protein